jgi:hypothetical protein
MSDLLRTIARQTEKYESDLVACKRSDGTKLTQNQQTVFFFFGMGIPVIRLLHT